MKIMVFAVPAGSGGALTILKQYHQKALQDNKNEWFFVVSTPDIAETSTVKILKYPWVKKSWFHRLFFDLFVAKHIAKKYGADEVLSLQNVVVWGLDVKQTLYLHLPLPFIDKRYSIFKDFKFWVYQNLIGKMIYKSVERADKVIVQTEWIKEACLKKVRTDPKKFQVEHPEVHVEVKKYYERPSDHPVLFFYPANSLKYKNHELIVEAAQMLQQKGVNEFKVIFTLGGRENGHIKELFRKVKDNDLPIEFIGSISLEEVYEYYGKSILVFPSHIETFGLPLLEAKMHHAPVLASDRAFSREILSNYEKVKYFDPHDHIQLFRLMEDMIANDL